MRETSAYNKRLYVLREMGFKSYAEYLENPLWKSIRREELDKNPFCKVCESRSNEVHHRSYSRMVMKGIDRNQLVSLCSECHRSIEYGDNGKKLSLHQANAKLDRKLNKRHSTSFGKRHPENVIPMKPKRVTSKTRFLPTLEGDRMNYRHMTMHNV